jgi:hypothetical protein
VAKVFNLASSGPAVLFNLSHPKYLGIRNKNEVVCFTKVKLSYETTHKGCMAHEAIEVIQGVVIREERNRIVVNRVSLLK